MISIPELALSAPPGGLVGVIEEGHARLAALATCAKLEPGTPLPTAPGDYLLNHWFATASRVAKAQGVSQLEALRRAGSSLVLLSHDEALLEQVADEIWWLREGKLVARGHPAEVLPTYRQHAAERAALAARFPAFGVLDEVAFRALYPPEGDRGVRVTVPVPVPEGVKYETTVPERPAGGVGRGGGG